MRRNFIPYGLHFIDDEDIEAVVKVLKSDFITQGPVLKAFEEALAEYCGARFAVCFSSGTAALHAAYFSLGLGEGDEFLTTPLTFIATSNAGLYLGARPIFCDIEPDTGNIDPLKIEKLVSSKVKLISVVHYAGHPCDMERIKEIADSYGLRVVEDASHAFGARYKGDIIGSCNFSDVCVFSFHPVKHITSGEGGAVLTNDSKIYERLLMFRTHGVTKNRDRFLEKVHGDWYYEMQFLGFNYRMSDINAALGLSQLKKAEKFLRKRRAIAKIYDISFVNEDAFHTPVEKEYAFHSYHLYTLRLSDDLTERKDVIFSKLRQKGLGVQVHYIPVYWHPFYSDLGYSKGLCPEAEDFYKRVISIPIYPKMSVEDIVYVIETIKEVLGRSD